MAHIVHTEANDTGKQQPLVIYVTIAFNIIIQ